MSVQSWVSNFFDRLIAPNSRFIRRTKDFILGLAIGAAFSLASTGLALYARRSYRKRITEHDYPAGPIEMRSTDICDGVQGLVGQLILF